jgi:hypothetical protein
VQPVAPPLSRDLIKKSRDRVETLTFSTALRLSSK